MTATSAPSLLSGVVNQVLAIKPLWNLAKGRARQMMIKRAESIGVPWRERVEDLRWRQANPRPSGNSAQTQSADWEADLRAVENPKLAYPAYYTTSFHAYDEGNLGWQPALEVEVAAQAVHAKLWPGAGATGDARLRQSYHDVLLAQIPEAPRDIVDLGCGIGMSTTALQALYPSAQVTGVDLSPYFLAVAKYRTDRAQHSPTPHPSTRPPIYHHAAAEATGLPAASYDLVSVCLVFHELPQTAAQAVIQEARRLLRPGGHLAIMDMNPQSAVLQAMPPFVLTLLKSTEPYLDEYFALDISAAFQSAGFEAPTIVCNSPRHRTIVGRVAQSNI
ncbi:MAG: methyltransferase domain-containing protein [Nodosilinea sp.]